MSHDKGTLDQLRIDRTAAPHSARRPVVVSVSFLAVLLIGAALWWFNRSKPIEVKTFAVRETSSSGGQQTLLNGSGYVTPRREATVSSKVTGKVIEVLIEEGMKVEAGQILARLDSSNVEASLRLAKAQIDVANSVLKETSVRIEEARRELNRISQLSADKIATAAELDRAQAELNSLTARLEKQNADVTVAEREAALWQQQLDDTIVRAPFAGVVTAKNAQPGEMISPMSSGGFTRTGICTIVDMNSLEIEVDVNERFINGVAPGQPVEATLDSYPSWRIPTKVIAIIPTADRGKATVKVRVGFEKMDPRILPQMGVKVAFQGDEKIQNTNAARSLAIPVSAVRSDNGRDVVWVVINEKLERRAITIGRKQSDQAWVTAGLAAGDKIVLEPPGELKEGSRVTEKKQ